MRIVLRTLALDEAKRESPRWPARYRTKQSAGRDKDSGGAAILDLGVSSYTAIGEGVRKKSARVSVKEREDCRFELLATRTFASGKLGSSAFVPVYTRRG